jgi:hypothetical protein
LNHGIRIPTCSRPMVVGCPATPWSATAVFYNGHTAGLWRVEGCDATFARYVNRGSCRDPRSTC